MTSSGSQSATAAKHSRASALWPWRAARRPWLKSAAGCRSSRPKPASGVRQPTQASAPTGFSAPQPAIGQTIHGGPPRSVAAPRACGGCGDGASGRARHAAPRRPGVPRRLPQAAHDHASAAQRRAVEPDGDLELGDHGRARVDVVTAPAVDLDEVGDLARGRAAQADDLQPRRRDVGEHAVLELSQRAIRPLEVRLGELRTVALEQLLELNREHRLLGERSQGVGALLGAGAAGSIELCAHAPQHPGELLGGRVQLELRGWLLLEIRPGRRRHGAFLAHAAGSRR